MRWVLASVASALFLLSPVELFAQSRTAVMTVSVTVVRSGPTSAGATSTNASSTANGTAAGNDATLIPGTAERPLPAPPRATESEVTLPASSAAEAIASVTMVTINY